MLVRFREEFSLPVGDVSTYFETPADWTRLYGLTGNVRDLGDGWYAVPLKNFPFPLVAKNVEQEPEQLVRWVFKGFWRGKGEVRFTATADGVLVEGSEEISVRWLFFLSPLIERLFLERKFHGIWEIGWRCLRKRQATLASESADENAGE